MTDENGVDTEKARLLAELRQKERLKEAAWAGGIGLVLCAFADRATEPAGNFILAGILFAVALQRLVSA